MLFLRVILNFRATAVTECDCPDIFIVKILLMCHYIAIKTVCMHIWSH